MIILKHLLTGKNGCILADHMGLGKTLQVLLAVYIYLKTTIATHALFLVPSIVINSWKQQVSKYLHNIEYNLYYQYYENNVPTLNLIHNFLSSSNGLLFITAKVMKYIMKL